MKLILRSYIKRKGIVATILISLIVAITTITLIVGYLVNELEVDSFHGNGDNIYRLLEDDPWMDNAIHPYILKNTPEYIKNNYPEVIDYCQMNRSGYEKLKANNTSIHNQLKLYNTNPSFISMFSYNFIEGDPGIALNRRSDIILTENTARNLFGDEPSIGKPISFEYSNGVKTYYVSGVIENHKYKSHFNFDMLTSIEGMEFKGCDAYLLLNNKAKASTLEKKLQNHKLNVPRKTPYSNYYLQSLKSIYLTKEVKSKLIVFTIIAFLILFVGFFNYINLLITQIFERKKELTTKRVIGGSFIKISNSLITEYFILVFSSLLISYSCVLLILPVFNAINESNLQFSNFFHHKVIGCIMAISMLIILFSYILIYLYLKRNSKKGHLIKSKIESFSIINIFQFAVSIALIISTIVVSKQLNYIHNKDIGLSREVIEMRLPASVAEKSNLLKELLLMNPAIENVSICSASPVREGMMILFTYKENGIKKDFAPLIFQGDKDYISTLGMEIVEGKDFHQHISNNGKCIVNQSMLKYFNMINPIGKKLPGPNYEIIGVVKDFHWNSLEGKITPSMISCKPDKGSNILVKVNPVHQEEAIGYIKQSWHKIIPDFPFEYITTGDWFNNEHRKYESLIRFITFFCVVAIFLSVIGLIARSIFTIKYKTKEIGIRKVNGAKILEVIAIINKNFILWISLAFVIATPAVYYVMVKWLDNFAYKTTLSWWIFALAGILSLFLVIVTVSLQSWKAASRNPVEALRYE